MSHDNVPTSPDVWPMLFRLRSVCKINGSDSKSMRDLKAAFLSSLDEKYIIHPLHKLSTLIVPSYKYLSFVNAEDRDFVYSIRDALYGRQNYFFFFTTSGGM